MLIIAGCVTHLAWDVEQETDRNFPYFHLYKHPSPRLAWAVEQDLRDWSLSLHYLHKYSDPFPRLHNHWTPMCPVAPISNLLKSHFQMENITMLFTKTDNLSWSPSQHFQLWKVWIQNYWCQYSNRGFSLIVWYHEVNICRAGSVVMERCKCMSAYVN